jgi:hypothetical protein
MKNFFIYLAVLFAIGLSACKDRTEAPETKTCEKAALELYCKYANNEGLTVAYLGDLTINGQRENVMVLRQVDGEDQTYIINLCDRQDILMSPAYYLQQNDIVYVEPNNYRKRQSSANATEITTASFWLSALSVLTTIAVLVFK